MPWSKHIGYVANPIVHRIVGIWIPAHALMTVTKKITKLPNFDNDIPWYYIIGSQYGYYPLGSTCQLSLADRTMDLPSAWLPSTLALYVFPVNFLISCCHCAWRCGGMQIKVAGDWKLVKASTSGTSKYSPSYRVDHTRPPKKAPTMVWNPYNFQQLGGLEVGDCWCSMLENPALTQPWVLSNIMQSNS